MKILLSIKPEFVKKIFSGEKKYEYRKTIFKSNINSIIVYSTKPEGKIVGELIVEDILIDTPEKIWEKTNAFSGINYTFFKNYFGNRKEGCAIKIAKTILYEKPIDPTEVDKSFRPPQSFCYINNNKQLSLNFG